MRQRGQQNGRLAGQSSITASTSGPPGGFEALTGQTPGTPPSIAEQISNGWNELIRSVESLATTTTATIMSRTTIAMAIAIENANESIMSMPLLTIVFADAHAQSTFAFSASQYSRRKNPSRTTSAETRAKAAPKLGRRNSRAAR